ncbi:MAG TPA: hypothetical protein VGG28_12205 [Kofleriaceae bacterium]
MKRVAIMIALVACSHADKRAQVEQALDAIGDQTAADARAAIAHPPKSRLGVAEIYAAVTPLAVIRQSETLARFGVTPADVAAVAADHPDSIDHLLARAQPALDQLGAAVASLPPVDAGDCAALQAKVAVLAKGSPADRSYAQMLATGLTQCVQPPPASAN